MDTKTTVARKRQRLLRACDNCHKHKTKCDGNNPCGYCRARDIDCVYSPPRKRGPKQGALRGLQQELDSAKSEIKALQEQVHGLQTQLQESELRNSQMSKENISQLREHMTSSHAPPAYMARAIEWIYMTDQPPPEEKGLPPNVDKAAVSAIADLKRLAIALQLPHATIVSTKVGWACYSLATPLCDPEKEKQYIRSYFAFSNSLLPMVDATYFADILRLLKREELLDAVDNDSDENTVAGATAALKTRELFPEFETHFDASMLPSTQQLHDLLSHAQLKSQARPHSGTYKLRGNSSKKMNRMDPVSDDSKIHGLLKVPHTHFSSDDTNPKSFTRHVPASAVLLFNSVLAVGARWNMVLDKADVYADRARTACVCGFDMPRLATVSGLLLLGYYRIGTSELGDLSQAKLYIALANEMADTVAAGTVPRIDDEAFNTLPSRSSSGSPTCNRQLKWNSKNEHLPHHVALACRLLSQLTSVSRGLSLPLSFGDEISEIIGNTSSSSTSLNGTKQFDPKNHESPRVRMTRILSFVALKLRRKMSTSEELRRDSHILSSALDEAEHIASHYCVAGAMNYSVLTQIHVCKAVLYHGCGDNETAQRHCNAVFEVIRSPLRLYGGYVDTACIVMLIPVLLSAKRVDKVQYILHLLEERAKIWPLANLLLAKARRRVTYSTPQRTAFTTSTRHSSARFRCPISPTSLRDDINCAQTSAGFPQTCADSAVVDQVTNLQCLADISHTLQGNLRSQKVIHSLQTYVSASNTGNSEKMANHCDGASPLIMGGQISNSCLSDGDDIIDPEVVQVRNLSDDPEWRNCPWTQESSPQSSMSPRGLDIDDIFGTIGLF